MPFPWRVFCRLQICLAAVSHFFTHRLDLACILQGCLGKQRPYQLVDQDGKERDVADQFALLAKLLCCDAHPQGNAGLRQKRDAEVLADGVAAVGRFGREKCTDVFAGRPGKDVDQTDQHDDAA